jgi:hypothetical protein
VFVFAPVAHAVGSFNTTTLLVALAESLLAKSPQSTPPKPDKLPASYTPRSGLAKTLLRSKQRARREPQKPSVHQ